MNTNYFDGCETIDAVRTRYRELVKHHHPDAGGDADTMQAVNAALEAALLALHRGHTRTWKQGRAGEADDWDIGSEPFAEVLRSILDLNVTIEIIGFWVYCFDAFEVRGQLKGLGFWFSRRHRAWVYSGRSKRAIRSSCSTDAIRARHGSRTVSEREERERLARAS